MTQVLRSRGLLIVTVTSVAPWRRRLGLVLLRGRDPQSDSRAVFEPSRAPHIRFFNPGFTRSMIVTADLPPVEVGGHSRGLIRDAPWLGQRFSYGEARRPNRWPERALPSISATTIYAVAHQDVIL
jgi:hypothetical protein